MIDTIGLVPIEEYCFFVLQPLATGLLFEVLRSGAIARSGVRAASPLGVTVGAGLTIAGIAALVSDFSEYLGLILVWAGPVVIIQWLYDGRLLAQTTASWAIPLAASTCYLWIADAIAIRIGIWSISDAHTSGLHLGSLPIEEMTFFLLTNAMVLFGLVLLEAAGIRVTSRNERQP
ncbi:MAG TPA: lycopene cyclase domain-containing protein [Rhodothermales bacterium]|nr:lycopene cyclase domain-containing protein [Rhodothermales bacterium]